MLEKINTAATAAVWETQLDQAGCTSFKGGKAGIFMSAKFEDGETLVFEPGIEPTLEFFEGFPFFTYPCKVKKGAETRDSKLSLKSLFKGCCLPAEAGKTTCAFSELKPRTNQAKLAGKFDLVTYIIKGERTLLPIFNKKVVLTARQRPSLVPVFERESTLPKTEVKLGKDDDYIIFEQ